MKRPVCVALKSFLDNISSIFLNNQPSAALSIKWYWTTNTAWWQTYYAFTQKMLYILGNFLFEIPNSLRQTAKIWNALVLQLFFKKSMSYFHHSIRHRTTNMTSTMNLNPWNRSKQYQNVYFKLWITKNKTNYSSLNVQNWHLCQYHWLKKKQILFYIIVVKFFKHKGNLNII